MSISVRRTGGVRLPLFLLLGFLIILGGIALWLETAETPPTDRGSRTPIALETEPQPAPVRPPDPATARQPNGPRPETGEVAAPQIAAPPSAPLPGEAATEREALEQESAEPVPAIPLPAPGGVSLSPGQTAAIPPAAIPPAAVPSAALPSRPQVVPRAVMPDALSPVPPDPPLSAAPDPALVQESALGPLPRIGTDGRAPWQVYAKPFAPADRRPRVAVIVSGLGLSAAATESAIQGLPGGVTLAFAPYASELDGWIRLARAAGHEVLLSVPMEPLNYPAYDPGPQTLLTSLNAQGNLDRLMWILSRGTGYVGVIDFMGSRFLASREHLSPVLAAIADRGLLFVDSGSAARSATASVSPGMKLPWAPATLTLDARASRVDIDKKFSELEQIARRDGRAIGIASSYPVTLERVATWSRQLEARGIAVAPVSALVAVSLPRGASQ